MRPCKRDANEKEIVKALRKVGATVEFLDIKNGPDLLVGYMQKNYLFEIKQEGKELREKQREWHDAWHGYVATVRSVEDALCFIGAIKWGG